MLSCTRTPPTPTPRYVVLEKLPLTSSGKCDRGSLPEPPAIVAAGADGRTGALARGSTAGGADVAPGSALLTFGSGSKFSVEPAGRSSAATGKSDGVSASGSNSCAVAEGEGENSLRTATEIILGEVWGAMLGVAGVGPHDHFFELGGTSLQAAPMIVRLSERFIAERDAGGLVTRASGPSRATMNIPPRFVRLCCCSYQDAAFVRPCCCFVERLCLCTSVVAFIERLLLLLSSAFCCFYRARFVAFFERVLDLCSYFDRAAAMWYTPPQMGIAVCEKELWVNLGLAFIHKTHTMCCVLMWCVG
jgi:hypothetical protein